jgi:hypothetical protein
MEFFEQNIGRVRKTGVFMGEKGCFFIKRAAVFVKQVFFWGSENRKKGSILACFWTFPGFGGFGALLGPDY